MRYFGSKVTTLPTVLGLVQDTKPSTICDPFGGMANVGRMFKRQGYVVTTGDQLNFAHQYQIAHLEMGRFPAFRGLAGDGLAGHEEVASYLNELPGISGWITLHYSRNRKFFRPANARRIDAVWQKIEEWHGQGLTSTKEHSLLTASLIDSMDWVANTAGTYYAYLKNWSYKASRTFKFNLIQPTPGPVGSRSFLGDAKETASMARWNILYLDPPYNSRSYARYYHLPETVSRFERPKLRGKSGTPDREFPLSSFNRRSEAYDALDTLIAGADFRTLIFHYSDDGLIKRPQVRRMLSKYGTVNEHLLDSKGYTTAHGPRTTPHRVYVVQNG